MVNNDIELGLGFRLNQDVSKFVSKSNQIVSNFVFQSNQTIYNIEKLCLIRLFGECRYRRHTKMRRTSVRYPQSVLRLEGVERNLNAPGGGALR